MPLRILIPFKDNFVALYAVDFVLIGTFWLLVAFRNSIQDINASASTQCCESRGVLFAFIYQ